MHDRELQHLSPSDASTEFEDSVLRKMLETMSPTLRELETQLSTPFGLYRN